MPLDHYNNVENIVIKKSFFWESSEPIMETLEVSALEEPTLAVAEGLSMTSLFEHSVAEPTETSCLMNGDLSKLAQKSPKFYF